MAGKYKKTADNKRRAGLGLDALGEYETATGSEGKDALSDLLCDLMHAAAQNGRVYGSFWAAVKTARGHFDEEKDGSA